MRLRLGAALAAMAFVFVPAASAQASPPTQAISIYRTMFRPKDVTVVAPAAVTWTDNEVRLPHTATSDTGVFDSGVLSPGNTFQYTFATPDGGRGSKCFIVK